MGNSDVQVIGIKHYWAEVWLHIQRSSGFSSHLLGWCGYQYLPDSPSRQTDWFLLSYHLPFVWASAGPFPSFFVGIWMLASPECFLPAICMCYGVSEDREQTPQKRPQTEPLRLSSWLASPFRCSYIQVREECQKRVHSRGIPKTVELWSINGASLFLTFSAPEQIRHCLWACPKVFVFMGKICGWRNGNKSIDSYLLKHSSVIWTNLNTVLKCGAFESIYSKNTFQMSQKILLMKVLKYLQRKKV